LHAELLAVRLGGVDRPAPDRRGRRPLGRVRTVEPGPGARGAAVRRAGGLAGAAPRLPRQRPRRPPTPLTAGGDPPPAAPSPPAPLAGRPVAGTSAPTPVPGYPHRPPPFEVETCSVHSETGRAPRAAGARRPEP